MCNVVRKYVTLITSIALVMNVFIYGVYLVIYKCIGSDNG